MHYILEIFIYRFHEGPIIYCGHRLGSKDYPGVWVIEGKVFVDRRDTLEERHVYLHTARERVHHCQRYSGSITWEFKT